MEDQFNVQRTSPKTATVNDVRLDTPSDPDTSLRRRIMRPELVDNAHSDVARVKIAITHQKRHKSMEPWQEVDNFKLSRMKAGEEVKLPLDSAETYKLYETLKNLFAITKDGFPRRDGNFTVVDESKEVVVKGKYAELVRRMTEQSSEEFWDAVQQLEPSLFQAVALTKLHEIRDKAVREFDQHLKTDDWKEDSWQRFFDRNTWIFGYGLNYQFLATVIDQPYYGGTTVVGSGGQRGDFLTASMAHERFTVLVEIKRPSSVLVEDKLYRNKVHCLGEELTGGVAQLQSNCRTWEVVGAQIEDNRQKMADDSCHTFHPKGVLIIGRTNQLDTSAKRSTFQLFRSNLQNPHVITFDELYERAKHLLLTEGKEIGSKASTK